MNTFNAMFLTRPSPKVWAFFEVGVVFSRLPTGYFRSDFVYSEREFRSLESCLLNHTCIDVYMQHRQP